MLFSVFFFFKQKTAYEMRISDWSSDVCSSDLYRHEDVAARVRELTNGKGVPVVYDGVGRDTFAGSLASLAPRGLLVSFGNASGAVEPFAPALLRSEEHTSELQSLMRISYAVFCLKKNTFAQIYRLCNSATQHVSAKESECFIIC